MRPIRSGTNMISKNMSILSDSAGGLLNTIQEQYFVGCYINDITEIVGGPDTTGHYRDDERICRELCHWVVDMMMEWSTSMLDIIDLPPLLIGVFKEPDKFFIVPDDRGYERSINVTRKEDRHNILKIVLTPKEWVA